ncbi:cleft lip and palate transmembrane protein 1-like protein [Ctenocephalides felis]|uniref:cleft lip and palate transmembrane protein 1-like protein n=1 Tax=Ctenocephalides felis TaxID=7515 RepID=UPI000E6E3E04|nr:cleft lip and palate transmembrane protein 1-like protein [Ctenocephalides felis]
MWIPSISFILISIFIIYMIHSMWTLAQLFIPSTCSETTKYCLTSFLKHDPKLQLLLYTSVNSKPTPSDVKLIQRLNKFEYLEPFEKTINLDLPEKTINNGSLFMHIIIVNSDESWEWSKMNKNVHIVAERIKLTQYALPQAAYFNLLSDQSDNYEDTKDYVQNIKPVTHLKSRISFTMLTDKIEIAGEDIPYELTRHLRLNSKREFLPIVQHDFLRSRLRDLVEVSKDIKKTNFTVSYIPVSIGRLRLLLHVESSLLSMKKLGFTDKDIDEVKGIFADTNIYLLCGTVLIGSLHLLFDFLAFKNDVLFWRKKKNMIGLSSRTVLWRTFSQIVVFLYLLDEHTSLLILIPHGIGTIIELWKARKVLKVKFNTKNTDVEEKRTEDVDAQAMKYLSYVLYPLCVCGAIYSLIYQPHKSWYSWCVHSLVNGVYAFGFLFMLPQLFVNYKLQSVAALPWRAFMYKAFNTFIDDVFAFIITMPTAHRVACFRDDIVFIIYLYQRWLYPVDASRSDDPAAAIEEEDVKKTN